MSDVSGTMRRYQTDGERKLVEELFVVQKELAAVKADLESLKTQALERRRDRVLEVALRLFQADATRGGVEPTAVLAEYISAAVEWIAEVERQVTP